FPYPTLFRSRIDDGVLELATVSGIGRAQLLRLFPRVFAGTHTSLAAVDIRPVQQLTIGLRHGRTLRAYADGEPRTVLPLSARVLPGAVRLLAELPPATVDPEDVPRPHRRTATPAGGGRRISGGRRPSWPPSPAATPSPWTTSSSPPAEPSRAAAPCWSRRPPAPAR